MNKYKIWAKTLHKNDYGEPFEMTDGQAEIFKYIYEPEYKRVGIKAVTQYGKSDITSMATIHILTDRPTKVLIVSPRMKQSQIIMGYIIQHFFDNPELEGMLEVSEPLERLKRERSKSRITLRNGSEVAVLTADTRTVSQEAKSLMGFGADVVINDESGLIPSNMFAKIFRMIGGHKYGKLVQLGNPFPSDHFEAIFKDPNYKTLTIDWKQAVKEGRFTEEYIEEARRTITRLDFRIFYDCEFPEREGMLFRALPRVMNARPVKPLDRHHYVMGVDLAKVEDWTVLTVYDRTNNKQVYQDRFQNIDWGFQKKKIKIISEHYNKAVIVIDATGLGDPVADDLLRDGMSVIPVKFSNPMKKELIEKLVLWIEQGMIQMLPIKETKDEFENFIYEKLPSGSWRYNAKEGFHDDIVWAHALAVKDLTPIYEKKESTKKRTPLQRYKEQAIRSSHGETEYEEDYSYD